MRITDLNKEGGIGSNSLLVELGPFLFVVDAGLHPKLAGSEAAPDFSPYKNRVIDFVIITHCHLDHIGSLPLLLRNRPETPVLMSQASAMLIERMLHNSCNVMKRQKAEQNISEYPLFAHEDVDAISRQFEPAPFGKRLVFRSGEDEVFITLHAAGHVAGAGGFEIEYAGRRYFFTGDVLFDAQQTLDGARFPEKRAFDVVVLETTRGEAEKTEGVSRQSEIKRLLGTISDTLTQGGSVLIPVFALGRMQEILTVLNNARKQQLLPRSSIYGAGLGLDLADYLDQIAKRTGQSKFNRRVLKELRLRRPPRNLKPGREPPEQGIYVLSSGMMVEKTPSYGLAASLLGHGRNAICFVGYCDPSTPGGKLQAAAVGERFTFEALDFETPIRARIERFELSGHADREEIVAFALQAKPKTIILTHGDPGARAWFEAALRLANPETLIIDPPPLKAIEI